MEPLREVASGESWYAWWPLTAACRPPVQIASIGKKHTGTSARLASAEATTVEMVTLARPRRRGTGIGSSSPACTNNDSITNSARASIRDFCVHSSARSDARRRCRRQRGVEDERPRDGRLAVLRVECAREHARPRAEALNRPAYGNAPADLGRGAEGRGDCHRHTYSDGDEDHSRSRVRRALSGPADIQYLASCRNPATAGADR